MINLEKRESPWKDTVFHSSFCNMYHQNRTDTSVESVGSVHLTCLGHPLEWLFLFRHIVLPIRISATVETYWGFAVKVTDKFKLPKHGRAILSELNFLNVLYLSEWLEELDVFEVLPYTDVPRSSCIKRDVVRVGGVARWFGVGKHREGGRFEPCVVFYTNHLLLRYLNPARLRDITM